MLATAPTNPKLKRTLDKGLVLLVDDDLETRASASELLADMNFWPITTRNGLEALELLRRGVKPMAVLVDLYMPLMDGEAFCEALDGMPDLDAVPRFLISADRTGERRASRCKATGFLHKPLSGKELEQALAQVRAKNTPDGGR